MWFGLVVVFSVRVRLSVRIRVRLWIGIYFRHTITSRSSTASIPSSHDPTQARGADRRVMARM